MTKQQQQIHTYSFSYPFPLWLLSQDTKCSSLCYTVRPCCFSVLCAVVGICSSLTPNLSFSHHHFFGNHKFVFESVGLPLFPKSAHLCHSLDPWISDFTGCLSVSLTSLCVTISGFIQVSAEVLPIFILAVWVFIFSFVMLI